MEKFDLKKREQDMEERENEKNVNGHLKVWRTKRTEVNNEDGNAKLFHRSGFGDPYLEENSLKEVVHDRKRRSKGTPSDEKCYANEAALPSAQQLNENERIDEKNLIELSKTQTNDAANAFEKIETNDLGGVDAFGRVGSKLTSDTGGDKIDEAGSKAREARKEEGKDGGKVAGGNYQDLSQDLSQDKSIGVESSKLTGKGKQEKEESLVGGNTLQITSESMSNNELPSVPAAVAAAALSPSSSSSFSSSSSSPSSSEIASSSSRDKEEEEERKKEVVRGATTGNEGQKLSAEQESAEQGKRSADGTGGNVNLHLESENKNFIQYSNENVKEGKRQAPFMLDMFNVKKTLLEKEDKPGKSISTIFNMKLAKAEVDTAAVKDCTKRGGDEKEVEIPITNGILEFEKNKVKEVPYEDTGGLAPLSSNIMERNTVDEKRLKNSGVEFDKRSGQSGMNEEGIRNWLEGDHNRMDGSASMAEKRSDASDGKVVGGKFKNEEECLNDNAVDNNNNNNGNNNFVDKSRGNVGKEKELGLMAKQNLQSAEVKEKGGEIEGERKRKKKHQGGGFVQAEMNDQMASNERVYPGQRKILQYMEYSNDEVEDADSNYNDREEEENQRQSVNAGKRRVVVERVRESERERERRE